MLTEDPVTLYVYRGLLYLFEGLSLIVYIRVVWIIVSERRRNSIFQNFFFKIFLMEAVTDISSFFIIFFLAFVRKYRLIVAVDEFCQLHSTGFVPMFTAFMLTSTRGSLYFGPLWFALNRLTTFTSCFGGRKHWNGWHLIICILVQISPFVIGAHLYLSNNGTYNVSFVFLNANQMLISQPLAVTQRAATYHIIISVLVAALSLATYLYILVLLRLQRNRSTSNLIHVQKERCVEIRLLCFSMIQFVVFVLNCIISILLSSSEEQHGSTTVKEIWALGTDLMCLTSPWGLIITSSTVRQYMFAFRNGLTEEAFD